jgi:predicted amidohydrolase YtcJ
MGHMTSPRIGALLLCLLAACNRTPPADMVVFGRAWTGNPEQPWAGAVAIRGDTIIAVGDSADLLQYVGSKTHRLDNGSAMVVPGFMDGHLHFLSGGYQLANVDLRQVNSQAEFIATIKAFASELKPGEWIQGGDWDHERWEGTPLPTRQWIDSVTPNNPVFVNRLDGHMGLANSAALRAAGITRSTPEVPGGMIVRDPRTGEPTGILRDLAMNPVYGVIPPPTPQQDDVALERAIRFAFSRGVTAVADLFSEGPSYSSIWTTFAAAQRARAAGKPLVRFAFFPAMAEWRRVADTIRARGEGDDWIRLAGVKGYVDGSLGSTTALFYEPYNDAPNTRGIFVTSEDSLRSQIGRADSAGLQVVVHAIGERANGVLLDIFDSVAQAHGPRDRRFRIEHAQHLRREDIDRIAATGVIASMQPYHAVDDGRWAEKRIGPERIKTTYAFRSLLERKAHLAFGSDWTVAPIDPILGIYAAVTRRTLDGKNPEGWIPDQKISVEETLRSYTYENAYGVFAEQHRGMLKPGYLADLVLLDQDLTKVQPNQLDRVRVKATVVGGRVMYEMKD